MWRQDLQELADDLKTLLEKDYYHKATVIIGLDALTKVLASSTCGAGANSRCD
jgi:hypothetical protein